MENYDAKVNKIINTLKKVEDCVEVDGYGDNLDVMLIAVNSYLIGVAAGSGDPTLVKHINTALAFENLLNE